MTHDSSITEIKVTHIPVNGRHELVYLDAAGVLWLSGQPWPGAVEDLRARINAHLARVRRFNAAQRGQEAVK